MGLFCVKFTLDLCASICIGSQNHDRVNWFPYTLKFGGHNTQDCSGGSQLTLPQVNLHFLKSTYTSSSQLTLPQVNLHFLKSTYTSSSHSGFSATLSSLTAWLDLNTELNKLECPLSKFALLNDPMWQHKIWVLWCGLEQVLQILRGRQGGCPSPSTKWRFTM